MKSEEKLDEILWSIRWSAAIAPELSMIPGRSVFLCASESGLAEVAGASAATTIHEHDGHFVYRSGCAAAFGEW